MKVTRKITLRGKHWTNADEGKLIQMLGRKHDGLDEIARKFGVSPNAVQKKALALGVSTRNGQPITRNFTASAPVVPSVDPVLQAPGLPATNSK